jgi:environmental stress-induced protein Ves
MRGCLYSQERKDKNMSWSRVSAADVQPQAWKNQGGTTRELLAWPHAHDWAVRVSVARVERDGPFSAFPGVHRWMAVIRGAGLRLFDWPQMIGDEPLRFDGGLAPEAELIRGDTDVFNVMERRGNLEIESAHHVLLPRTPWVALFTVSGGLLEHGHRAMPMAPLTLAWCENPVAQSCVFTGEGNAWWLTWSDEG